MVGELQYRLAGAASGVRPGAHRSRGGDAGFEFRGHAALQDAPDARRLDLHASLRDPFGGWVVRLHAERKAIAVAVVADLSASMGFAARVRKTDVLADFTESLAWSAWRNGDGFGFVGAGEQVDEAFVLPQTRQRGAGLALAERLRTLQPAGRSAHGLLDAHRHLPARRALVFLVSDFHWPLDALDAVLDSLALHQVVPVVLWQPAEFSLGEQVRGVAQVLEPESGQRRWLWWRPALQQRWAQAHAERRAALSQAFGRHRLSPLFIEAAFDADAVTRHFVA